MNIELKKSILQTLAYFDIFSHPLTLGEISNWLWNYGQNLSIASLADGLTELKNNNLINEKFGYYFLGNKEEIIEIRRSRQLLVEEKMKIAVRASKILSFTPFLQAVFVCNTVSAFTPDEDSDIDVFVVVKSGRIWIARFLATFFLTIFGLRRTKKKIKNKICLSFYTTDDNLDFSGIKISEPDIYMCFWLTQLIPIFDKNNISQKIIEKNNWIKKYLPRAESFKTVSRWRIVPNFFSKLVVQVLEKTWASGYGDLIEKQAKIIQKNKMKMNSESEQNLQNNHVIINDSMLKFHEKDRREEYQNEWGEKCRTLLQML